MINEIFKTSFPIPYIIEKELSKEECCILVHTGAEENKTERFSNWEAEDKFTS